MYVDQILKDRKRVENAQKQGNSLLNAGYSSSSESLSLHLCILCSAGSISLCRPSLLSNCSRTEAEEAEVKEAEVKEAKAVSFKLCVGTMVEFAGDAGSSKFEAGGGSDVNS